MEKLIRTALTLFVASLLFACGSSEEIIAKVGDKAITKKQFEAYLQFKRVNSKDEKQREAHLKLYLEREKLTAAIEKSKALDDALMQAELEEFKKEMLISRYFEKHLRDKVSDDAIRSYYASNSGNYESKKAKVAHILIRTEQKMSETERTARYTRAAEAYSQLTSGKDFAEIAKQYSEDSVSVKKGGVIGWINQGAIDPLFSKKVFEEMKKDQVSEPFQTSFGYHIVKLLEEPAVVKKPLESVKGDIRYQLRQKVRQAETERLMETTSLTMLEKKQ
ncbi:peptidylprolyl isomerase [Aliikangiella coralliicola]|uniref:peptidylprolyl isomerase n=2 Tax=Aliikangiella coralliicola TaxID=2592383 RepID=A0A545UDB5_9GAMM|nr:peptidylprolyl isomerase [Aliikangiella coralliicola]